MKKFGKALIFAAAAAGVTAVAHAIATDDKLRNKASAIKDCAVGSACDCFNIMSGKLDNCEEGCTTENQVMRKIMAMKDVVKENIEIAKESLDYIDEAYAAAEEIDDAEDICCGCHGCDLCDEDCDEDCDCECHDNCECDEDCDENCDCECHETCDCDDTCDETCDCECHKTPEEVIEETPDVHAEVISEKQFEQLVINGAEAVEADGTSDPAEIKDGELLEEAVEAKEVEIDDQLTVEDIDADGSEENLETEITKLEKELNDAE